MGWSSGYLVFDHIVSSFIDSNLSRKEKIKILVALIEALEDQDWDCQFDSKYWDNSIVVAAWQRVHPEWFDSNGELVVR